jgi:hypothetical protein
MAYTYIPSFENLRATKGARVDVVRQSAVMIL